MLAALLISIRPPTVVLRIGEATDDASFRFGGAPSENDESLSGVWTSGLKCLGESLERRGGNADMEGMRLRPGILGEGRGDTGRGPGEGGAIIPWETSLLAFGRKRGIASKGKALYKLRKSDERPGGATG